MFETIAIDPGEPITIVAALVAVVAAALLTHPSLDRIGRDARLWRRVRSLLPYVDEAARDHGFYTSYKIGADEVAGALHVDAYKAGEILREQGFRTSPLAAHKEFDGRGEVGSWGRFGPIKPSELPWPLSTLYLIAYPYQLHVTLFPDGEGGVLVTAHREYSPYNPLVAYWHLRGKGLDVDAGVAAVADALADFDEYSPSDRAMELKLEEAAANVEAEI